jgi:SAM-dependent methyltransferase
MTEFQTPDEILAYYDQGREQERLATTGVGRLELERTQDILARHLPASGRILDIGGGAGVHAAWLAGAGYTVELFDPIPLHVEQARAASAAQHDYPFAVELGDARSIARPDSYADVVLMLGPLYHLPDAQDRRAALKEARRLLKPGGTIVAAGISRYAALIDGVRLGMLADPGFVQIVDQDLATGDHRNPTRQRGWFTTAFFHHPDELRDEVSAAGFDSVRVLVVEGFAQLVHDLDDRLHDPVRRTVLLDALRKIEETPCVLGITGHLIAIGKVGR